ncbi:MAG: hypothetical protein WB791_06635 [Waddliaceae bacterium]
MVSRTPPPPCYAPPPLGYDASISPEPDLQTLSLEVLRERFTRAGEAERQRILLACIEKYFADPNEFQDESLILGFINLLIRNALYACKLPISNLSLSHFRTLEECKTDSGWAEEIDVDRLYDNLTDASDNNFGRLAALFNDLFFLILRNKDPKLEELQHWERYCRVAATAVKYAMSNYYDGISQFEFIKLAEQLTDFAGRGSVLEQSQPFPSKRFQKILEDLLEVVASEICSQYFEPNAEIDIRKALIHAYIWTDPDKAREQFPYLIELLEKSPIDDFENSNYES